jgi:hypothetical protein
MIRISTHLREDQTRNIRLKARIEKKPEAELIRDLIDKGWSAAYGKGASDSTGDALLRLARVGEELKLSGPTDLSSRIDDELYGKNI